MSVTNKTIRELESAAIEAVLAMNELADLLVPVELRSGGYIRPAEQARAFVRDQRIANRIERLRIAAIELDRAETACSRERTLTMSEAEMREEYEALGLDWDETTERGQALLQKLLAECDARREAEVANVARPLAGIAEVFEAEHDKVLAVEAAFSGPRSDVPPEPVHFDPRAVSKGMFPTHIGQRGAHYGDGTFLEADPQLCEAGEIVAYARRMAETSLPVDREYWMSEAEIAAAKLEKKPDWRPLWWQVRDLPEPPLSEGEIVQLGDSDVARLLADQIAEEFGVEHRKLEDIPHSMLLRLHAELARARRLRLPAFALAPQILDIIGRQPGVLDIARDRCLRETVASEGGSVGERLAELAVRPGHAVREPGESEAEYISRLRAAYADADESTGNIWVTKRADPRLVDLPLGHQPGGLGDGGESPTESYFASVERLEARALLKANGWVEEVPGDWSPDPALGWSIDINRKRCSPAILRALAILAEGAQL